MTKKIDISAAITAKADATAPVEKLAAEFGVSAPALAGMKTAYGWTPGTRLGRGEFAAKVRAWLGTPAGGK